jgi:hypothetical protein
MISFQYLDADAPTSFDVDGMKEDSVGISDLEIRIVPPTLSLLRDPEFSARTTLREIGGVPMACL